MLLKMIHYLLLILLPCAIQITFCLEERITVNVEPLKEDCFFQPLKTGDKLQIEYQVIGGGHGDLDISFNLVEPMGRVVVADFKKPEKSHSIDIGKTGDYRFCFDNTFSSFNTKTVYFEIDVYNSSDDEFNSFNADISFEDRSNSIDLQQFEGFNEAINTVRSYLSKARALQDLIKVTEAKDRNVAEETHYKVTTYSIFVLLVMILVSFVQIVMVKSIFDDKSKIYKVLCFLDVKKR